MPTLPKPLLLALLIPLAAGCDRHPAAPAAALARPVLVQRVAFADNVPERRLVATVRPRVEADLGFRIGGKVAARLVDVGDRVAAGQALARLDEADVVLQREQASAERAAASASLDEAQADLRRTNTLAGQGWTAAAAADRQKAATEEARGRMLRADRALTLAQNASTYAVLRADADGVVTAAPVEAGQVVTAGQLAVRLAHTSGIEVEVAIPEALVDRVRSGRASLALWSDPGHVHRARLRELAPAADLATRTFRARFALPDAPAAAAIGMTGTLTLADGATERVARLPLSALFDQGAGPSVWTVSADGRLALKPVTVAAYGSGVVTISKGVEEGDAVVAMGVQKLDRRLAVRTVDALQF